MLPALSTGLALLKVMHLGVSARGRSNLGGMGAPCSAPHHPCQCDSNSLDVPQSNRDILSKERCLAAGAQRADCMGAAVEEAAVRIAMAIRYLYEVQHRCAPRMSMHGHVSWH